MSKGRWAVVLAVVVVLAAVAAYAAGIAGGQAAGEPGEQEGGVSLPGSANATFTVEASRGVGLGGELLVGYERFGVTPVKQWDVHYLGKDGAGARHLRIKEAHLVMRSEEQFDVIVPAEDSKAFALTALASQKEPVLVKVSLQDEGAAVVSASVLDVVVGGGK